jgi:hypothetical protein
MEKQSVIQRVLSQNEIARKIDATARHVLKESLRRHEKTVCDLKGAFSKFDCSHELTHSVLAPQKQSLSRHGKTECDSKVCYLKMR